MYKSKEKRKILVKVEDSYKQGLNDEQILLSWKNLPCKDKEKKALLQECKAYIFLSTIFYERELNREVAINLAKRYIEYEKINPTLIKELLVTFYIECKRFDESEELAKSLKETEPNSRNIANYAIILREKGNPEEALKVLKGRKCFVVPELFLLRFNILKELNDIDKIITLALESPKLVFGKQSLLAKEKYLDGLRECANELRRVDRRDAREAVKRINSVIDREDNIRQEER